MKIKAEIEVGNGEFCGNCPMLNWVNDWKRNVFCSLFRTYLSFSPRYLAYVRCDECKQAEVKNEN